MPPKSGSDDDVPNSATDNSNNDSTTQITSSPPDYDQKDQKPKRRIVWMNVYIYSVLHLLAIYGFYVAVTKAMWPTLIWAYFLYIAGGMGITAGAHRLWSHRTYKAKAPLRFILMICNCIALQNDVIEWARDHRVHHRHSETTGDPHDATRGFFFAHMGWLLVRKHPDVIKKGKAIDLSDLYADPILVFQRRYYWPIAIFLCFIMPTLVPMYFWNENALTAFLAAGVFRYTWLLHCTWGINSIAHLFGNRPYDKTINPRQNLLAAMGSLGEGWHNYHHVFPFDYRAAEFPYLVNFTTVFIDAFAKIGWVYDRKSVSKEMIEKKKLRSGENFLANHDHNHNEQEVEG